MIEKKWLAVAGLMMGAGASQAGDIEIGAVAGTLGLGGQVSYGLTERLSVRALVAGFDTDLDFEAEGGSDLDYEGSVDLLHAAALVDYRPFAGTFRLTGGLMFNDDSIDGDARCMQLACNLGDNEGVLVAGDTLSAAATYDPVSPYIGIGWGKSPSADGGWGLSADIGVFYLGDPEVEVDLSGPSRLNPIARDAVAEEEQGIQEDLDQLPLYPVVMLGAMYRF